MKNIEAFQYPDGKIFINKKDAKNHENDLLGQELDGLLQLFNTDLGQTSKYKSIIQLMNRRSELLISIKSIVHILEHYDDCSTDDRS